MDRVVPNNISLQVLEEITEDFSEHRMIKGSFGKVYMGMHKDGEKIVVKLLYGMPGLDDEQFQNEFNCLKRINHQNIVRLICYYYETSGRARAYNTGVPTGAPREKLINHLGKLVIADKRYTALPVKFKRSSNNMDCMVPNNIPLQLLEEITDGFSEHRMIGFGSCGKVYMGVHKDGEKIAVKLLYGMPGLNDEQFQNEFNFLKRLDHQNIVRLVGCCDETKEKLVNHMGKLVLVEKRYTAICLEYMSSRSLDNYISDEYSGHSWSTRYKIIKGICEGIKYLHEELNPPIYHLDLKPANVLLDEDMLPKISDFGLSMLFGEEQTQIIRNYRGTHAYSPPEYKKRGVVSKKFDIFSLGVVIMKIMAGRAGYHKSLEMSSEQFIELVHGNWRNRLQEGSKCGIDMEIYSAQIKTCIKVAVRCVEYDRNKRPNIGDIVNKLNAIEKNVLLEKNIADFMLSSLLRIAKHGYSPPVFPPKKQEYPLQVFGEGISASEIVEEYIMKCKELMELVEQIQYSMRDVNPDGSNRPTPAEDRRRRSKPRHMKSRPTPAEDRRRKNDKTRHTKSSSASRYTLMRNWKY